MGAASSKRPEAQRQDGERACGFVDLHAKDFGAAAPGAIWEMWEAPKYEWLGSWAGYHPEHGLLGCECAADGSEVLTAEGARLERWLSPERVAGTTRFTAPTTSA